jgi:deoxyribonuclease-4
MKIGAHVSAAGGLEKSIDRALALGAETIQIFATGPQSWRPSTHSDGEIAALRRRAAEAGISPIFVHGVYLINLASTDPVLVNRSVGSLKQYLAFAAKAGAAGVIFHIGSHKGAGFPAVLPQIVRAIGEVLQDIPEAALILENSAGQGDSVGSRFAEIGAIIQAVGSPRVRVCLDTCHCFAAGYDVRTPSGVAAMVAEFEREVGLERLVVVHANDSKAGLGAGVDRHENIGLGQIGEEGFRAVLAHPAFREIPFILEVPGINGEGPDKANVEILKRLAAEVGAR